MFSLFTAAVSIGGAFWLGAKSAWESIEPWLSMSSGNRRDPPMLLYDIDVTDSRFFTRPSVRRAAHFAAEAHTGQIRKTREPYITHCIHTALIVERLMAPTEDDERAESAVIAALLHDTIDDTNVDISEITEAFGEQVSSMVSKVSQLSQTNQLVRRRLRLEDAQPSAEEAAQLRQMMLTMVSEPLVIVIKLADRLHNMRTVYALKTEKQVAVAQETRRVWCSLAERLGMFALKSELEDLCFAVLQPKEYTTLRAELDKLWGISTINAKEVTPSDCCLTGECDCECSYDDDDATFIHHGFTMPWLGAATAFLPKVQQSGSGGGKDSTGKSLLSNAKRGQDNMEDWLKPEQIEAKALLESVLPFDASTFNMERLNITPSARRGLEVLQGCAKALLQELTIEGVASGLDISVQGRVKSLYSIFKKMARKGIPISQVYDSRALRVVVNDEGGRIEREAISACYKLQPVVHRLWRRIVGEEDDYISQPKASGYQSLHTAVIGPGGIPMEVQIRTSAMHEVAEYGSAAHWAYKEKNVSTAGSAALGGPEAIRGGHPVLHISAGGQLKDGVVVRAENNGLRLLVAVSCAARKFESFGATKASPKEYIELLKYVEEQSFFTAGQGDLNVKLEMYTLCSDGKYHRIDQFGHKLPTTIVPLSRIDNEVLAVPVTGAGAAPEQVHTGGDSETSYMDNRIRLLRSMLEWGADINSADSGILDIPASTSGLPHGNTDRATTSENEDTSPVATVTTTAAAARGEIMVLVWPSGQILQLPRGASAGLVMKKERPNDAIWEGPLEGIRYVNVNNRLVPDTFPLSDGDYVVTTTLERVKF